MVPNLPLNFTGSGINSLSVKTSLSCAVCSQIHPFFPLLFPNHLFLQAPMLQTTVKSKMAPASVCHVKKMNTSNTQMILPSALAAGRVGKV